jgi:hypothetical protein
VASTPAGEFKVEVVRFLVAELGAACRTRTDLVVENMLLRHRFTRYYNLERPHRALDLETPTPVVRATAGPIRSRPVLSGLHHTYERAA